MAVTVAVSISLVVPGGSGATDSNSRSLGSKATASTSLQASATRKRVKLWPRNLRRYTRAKAVRRVRADYRSFSRLGFGSSGYSRLANALYKTWCSGNWRVSSCLVRGGFDGLPSNLSPSCDEPLFPSVSDEVPGCWIREIWQRTITVKRVHRRKVRIITSGPGLEMFRIYDSPSYEVPPPLLEFYYDRNGPGRPPLPM